MLRASLQRKQKEPEDARDAYQGCLRRIENFQKLKKQYLDMQDQGSTEGYCMRCALLQEICLIGDTLTWLRDGPFGYEFEKFPIQLKVLAREFDQNAIRNIITRRNDFSHKFLYKTVNDKANSFQWILEGEVDQSLNKIQAKMKTQLVLP